MADDKIDMTQGVGDVITRVTNSLPYDKMLSPIVNTAINAMEESCARYIKFIKALLDKEGKPITITAVRKENDDQGNERFRSVEMPLLCILEHPVMGKIKFSNDITLEISDTFTQKIDGSLSGGFNVGAGFLGGLINVNVESKFSASYGQTRNSSTAMKQTLHIEGEQGPPPEGMCQMLDWLLAPLGFDNKDSKKTPAKQDTPAK